MSGWIRLTDPPLRKRMFRQGWTLPMFRRGWVSPPGVRSFRRSEGLGSLHRREARVMVSDAFGSVKRFFGW